MKSYPQDLKIYIFSSEVNRNSESSTKLGTGWISAQECNQAPHQQENDCLVEKFGNPEKTYPYMFF
jgi:hypothetical protein